MTSIHWIAISMSSLAIFAAFYVYYNRFLIYCTKPNNHINDDPSS